MAKYLLLAMNGPTSEADEAEYNRWYDDIHVPDLLALPGVTAAQRYKVIQSNQPFPYVAAYEIETDDLPELMRAMEYDVRPFTPAFDRSTSGHIVAVAL